MNNMYIPLSTRRDKARGVRRLSWSRPRRPWRGLAAATRSHCGRHLRPSHTAVARWSVTTPGRESPALLLDIKFSPVVSEWWSVEVLHWFPTQSDSCKSSFKNIVLVWNTGRYHSILECKTKSPLYKGRRTPTEPFPCNSYCWIEFPSIE